MTLPIPPYPNYIQYACVLGLESHYIDSLPKHLSTNLSTQNICVFTLTWHRQTTSTSVASISTTLPLPSSPH